MASGMFLPGQCYQFIHISCCGMHAFRSQGIHDSSHFVYRDAAHGCRISFQQDIEQAYCRVKFEVFPFLRQSETMENHFRFGRQGIIGLVAQFQLGFLRRREPVTLPSSSSAFSWAKSCLCSSGEQSIFSFTSAKK